ncbi:TRAP transporter small permease subunit [Candidatus Halocynthiibacter alkanivorans]|uniref:TRAP transporter small permease subunit n=1 Tax=Candidatus Halocynthiibacter alkanivorans TaxID=2267619 RepID=UPI000DF38281|nr:TRAP transporter small permease subunit [Candidatus Halocynthiibacter alkanivorans]
MDYSYKLSEFLHLLVEKICLYLVCALVISEITIVLLRYIYGIGYLQLHDFALYSFSALVVLSVVYCFGRNSHVRVDVFREKHSVRLKKIVDIVSIIGFLLPFYLMILYWVWPDILYAWSIAEGSRETGGLGGLFLVKTTLPVACMLLIVQGIAVVVRGGKYLYGEGQSAAVNGSESS